MVAGHYDILSRNEVSGKPGAVHGTTGALHTSGQEKLISPFQIFTKLLSWNQHMWGAFTNLGFCYLKNGNLDKAIAYMEKALELDPTHGESPRLSEFLWRLTLFPTLIRNDFDCINSLNLTLKRLIPNLFSLDLWLSL